MRTNFFGERKAETLDEAKELIEEKGVKVKNVYVPTIDEDNGEFQADIADGRSGDTVFSIVCNDRDTLVAWIKELGIENQAD